MKILPILFLIFSIIVNSRKFEILSVRKKLIKLFLCIAFLVFSALTFIMIFEKFEKNTSFKELVQSTEKIPDTIVTDNVYHFNLDKCLKTQKFEDCCMYEDNNGRYLTNPDCTVENILRIFDEFEQYYSDFNEELNDIESEFNIKEEFDVLKYKRKRRQASNTRELNDDQYYFDNHYINPSIDYSNNIDDDYVKLVEPEIANTENVYNNDLYSNNHETINYMANTLTASGINNNKETKNYAYLMKIDGNSNDQIEDNIANSYKSNQNNLENDYIKSKLPIISNSNEEVDDNSIEVEKDFLTSDMYQEGQPEELNEFFSEDSVKIQEDSNEVIPPWNFVNNQAPSEISHYQIYTVKPQNFDSRNDPTHLNLNSNYPAQEQTDRIITNEYLPETVLPMQDVAYPPIYPTNNSVNNINSNAPTDTSYNRATSAIQQPNNKKLEQPEQVSSFNDYVTALETPVIESTETQTTTYSKETTMNSFDNLKKNVNDDKSRRDSFAPNADATKLNMNNMNSRDFQMVKPKLNQFQGGNIDLQTSQHSAINTNFNGRQCQLLGSTYPYPQQLPFNYDASLGTQLAQLVPVTMPKSNPYIVPSYNVIQPNYYQPINNPLYPFSYNPYYNSMSSMIPSTPTSSLQAITSNGQYYICNPIASPSNNILNMPGVEIRDNSVQNLQDLVDGYTAFEEVK